MFHRGEAAEILSALICVHRRLPFLTIIIGQRWLAADGPANSGKKRVLPPKWDQRTLDKFFSDARSTLEGERPNFNSGASIAASKTILARQVGERKRPITPTPADDFAWSKLISPESLQDEIKSYQNLVKDDVKNPSAFKGEGFKRARRNFSMLAVAFAVIAEYDGDVRWKNQALAARDLFAKTGFNCKVATDQSFSDAKARADDLDCPDPRRNARLHLAISRRRRNGRRWPIARR